MPQQKYVYNKQTLQYENYRRPLSHHVRNAALIGASLVIVAFAIQYVLGLYFPTATEQRLNRELSQMEYRYELMQDRIGVLDESLQQLNRRDGDIHRLVFGMDPIPEGTWQSGVGGHDPADDIVDYSDRSEIIRETQIELDRMERQLALQTRSLDTIYSLALEKEDMLASIPSIKPVREKELNRRMRHMSGYGWRIHPIHKVRKFHNGIDFSAPPGTHVLASGDGRVVKVANRKTGFGKHIVIDHGFGYETLYGHLKEVVVKKGQRVVKGEKIGAIGSTGLSTAPHLHYEVHFKGRPVNPIKYCIDGLTPEEYEELVHRASQENQSLD